MVKIHGQRGFTDRLLLFAFAVLFIIAIVALPKYLKWRETAGQPKDVLTLRRIHAVEQKYRLKISIKNTYADFRQLVDTELIEPEPAFEINLNYEETRFCVTSGKYAVNTEGRIFEAETGTISCAMGEAAGTNVKEYVIRK